MRVFCVIDREDIVAAAKYMICGAEYVDLYSDALRREPFRSTSGSLGQISAAYHALVLAPEPKLADIG